MGSAAIFADFFNGGFNFLFSFGCELHFGGPSLARVVDDALAIGYAFLLEKIEVIAELHDMCGFHCGAGFDVVQIRRVCQRSLSLQGCQCPILCVFRVDNSRRGGVVRGQRVRRYAPFRGGFVEPEFACADV